MHRYLIAAVIGEFLGICCFLCCARNMVKHREFDCAGPGVLGIAHDEKVLQEWLPKHREQVDELLRTQGYLTNLGLLEAGYPFLIAFPIAGAVCVWISNQSQKRKDLMAG